MDTDLHVVFALFNQEAERFREHVAREFDSSAVKEVVAVVRRSGKHTFAERLMSTVIRFDSIN